MGRIMLLLLLQLQACGAFLAPPARAVALRVGAADEAGENAPAPPPTPEEEAALFEMLTAKFAAIEGSTYGAYTPEDLEAADADDSIEAELRRRVPASDRRASDARVVESIFDRGRDAFRDRVADLAEAERAALRVAADELAAEMAAEVAAFERRVDATARGRVRRDRVQRHFNMSWTAVRVGLRETPLCADHESV